MIDALLVFPPSWTLATGSPHVGLPLLKAFLAANGFEVVIRDLNWEYARLHQVELDRRTAQQACACPTLENMNRPYFASEDRLTALAAQYKGTWNAQLGFEYRDLSHSSSVDALAAVRLESPFTHYFRGTVAPFVAEHRPLLVGMSLASAHQVIPSLQLAFILREAGFDGFVVLGGNTVSRLAAEMALQWVFHVVDGLILFQGEEPLLRLCKTLKAGGGLGSVPHLVFRDGTRIVRNPGATPLPLSTLPPPDYRDLPVGHYWGENYLNIVAFRGCYYGKCSFCAIPYGWGAGGFAGQRPVDAVYNDMLTLSQRHGLRRFKFVDEALSPPFMRALASRILAGPVQMEWEGYVRLESAWNDPVFVELVGNAGFRKGYFGLELVPSDRRAALNKNDHADPGQLLELCCAAGIKVHFFCMFGYPGTGRKEAWQTTEFVLQHQDLIDTVDVFPWTYAKHTRVPGASAVLSPRNDWALEFEHCPEQKGVLASDAVAALAAECEDRLWNEVPRFLHPTYRLVSPWSAADDVSDRAAVVARAAVGQLAR